MAAAAALYITYSLSAHRGHFSGRSTSAHTAHWLETVAEHQSFTLGYCVTVMNSLVMWPHIPFSMWPHIPFSVWPPCILHVASIAFSPCGFRSILLHVPSAASDDLHRLNVAVVNISNVRQEVLNNVLCTIATHERSDGRRRSASASLETPAHSIRSPSQPSVPHPAFEKIDQADPLVIEVRSITRLKSLGIHVSKRCSENAGQIRRKYRAIVPGPWADEVRAPRDV